MNRKFKKIFLMLILIIVSCSSVVLAADYGPVQYDATGTPYIVTKRGGKDVRLTWDPETESFSGSYRQDSITSSGYGYDINVTYDEYEKSQSGNIPSKEELNNTKSESQQAVPKETEQQTTQETTEQQTSAGSVNERVIDAAKNGTSEDKTLTGTRDGDDFTLVKVDGEWAIVYHYGNLGGYDAILRWDPNQGIFVTTYNSNDGITTTRTLTYDEAKAIFGDDFPPITDFVGTDQHGTRDAAVAEDDHTMDQNIVLLLRKAISLWYFILRYVSIALMLIVLLVLGIRIAITTVASEKALYKKMLVDWFVGFIIVFTIHYIMIAIVLVNQMGIDLVKNTANKVYSQDQRVYVSDDPSEYGSKKYQSKTAEDLEVSLYESVRTRAYDAKLTNGCIGMVLYACLVYYAYKFTFIYLKRILNIAILTIISPLVAVSFAFNKIMTGKASIFSKWLKEYFTVVIIQFFHALAYVTFVMGALRISLSSITGIIFVLILLKYMTEAEKIIRTIFGMNSSAIQDLASTKGPRGYANTLKTAAGFIVGANAVGKANSAARALVFKPLQKGAEFAFGQEMLHRAENAIKDKRDLTDENLENPEEDKNFVDEIVDYDEETPYEDLTPEQQEMRDIVEGERYLDSEKYGVEYTGETPKYTTKREVDEAKARLAQNPKIILAKFRQNVHDAFDYRTYTERYAKRKSDGSYEVGVRYKKDKEHIHKKRKDVYKEIVRKQFSLKNLVGYTDEDMKDFQEGYRNVTTTVGGFMGSIVSMGSLADSGTFGLMGMFYGALAFQNGINLLRDDNKVEFLAPDFEDDPALSVYEIEEMRKQITDELITKKDKYIVNSIARKHRTLARRLSTPFEVGLAVTTWPAGILYRDVSKTRWDILKFDLTEDRKALEKKRLRIIQRIEETERTEEEIVNASVSKHQRITELESEPETVPERSKWLKELRTEVATIDKKIAKIDKKLDKLNKRQQKAETASKDATTKQEEFIQKHGHISRSGGIGYSARERAAKRTLEIVKKVNKESTKVSKKLWEKAAKEAKEEREERESRPINQYINSGLQMGVLTKAHSVVERTNPDGSSETIEEELIVPVYTNEDGINVTSNVDLAERRKPEEEREEATDQFYKECVENYNKAQEKRKEEAARAHKKAIEGEVKLPTREIFPKAPVNFKVTMADVRAAIISAAAKQSKTVRKFELTASNNAAIRQELFGMVRKLYSIEGEIPQELHDYIMGLDSAIAYAKASLVAGELAASAITTQIEENGKDGVNVDQAVEMLEAGLKEYFEETDNMRLPESMRRHDYIEEDEILPEAGYDTIEGLARKTMDKKLEDMASIIRAKNADNEDGSGDSEREISQLREKLKESFKSKSKESEDSRESFRMFYDDKKRAEGRDDKYGYRGENADAQKKADSSATTVDTDLLEAIMAEQAESADDVLGEILSNVGDPEEQEAILEEFVATKGAQEADKQYLKYGGDAEESSDRFFDDIEEESYTPSSESDDTSYSQEPSVETSEETIVSEVPTSEESMATDTTTVEEPTKTATPEEVPASTDDLLEQIIAGATQDTTTEAGGELASDNPELENGAVTVENPAQPNTSQSRPQQRGPKVFGKSVSDSTQPQENEQPETEDDTIPGDDPNGERAYWEKKNATFAEPTPTYMDTSGTTGQNAEQGQNDQTTSSTKTSPKKKIGELGQDGVKKFTEDNGDGSKEFVLSGEDVEQKDPNNQKNKVGHMDLPTSDDNNNQ